MSEFIRRLEEEGYTLDAANTDTSGGENGLKDKYITLYKGDIQIVVQNIRTKYFYIYIYHLGDWILK